MYLLSCQELNRKINSTLNIFERYRSSYLILSEKVYLPKCRTQLITLKLALVYRTTTKNQALHLKYKAFMDWLLNVPTELCPLTRIIQRNKPKCYSYSTSQDLDAKQIIMLYFHHV